jgi:hypothetical protein
MVEGVNSSIIHLIYCKNFCKCHNAPPPSTIKNKNLKYFKDDYKIMRNADCDSLTLSC